MLSTVILKKCTEWNSIESPLGYYLLGKMLSKYNVKAKYRRASKTNMNRVAIIRYGLSEESKWMLEFTSKSKCISWKKDTYIEF